MFTVILNLASAFLNQLDQWDKWLFYQVNHNLSNGFFDSIFPWWRHQDTWLPLYLFLLLFMFINFGWKSWKWILFIIITVVITDQVSSSILKDLFHRIRPCRDPEFAPYVRLIVNYCPQSGSFTSSHAANHFGAAVFIHLTLGKYFKNYTWLFYFWAASVCFAQVYVGVHYPLDVLGGALLGTIVAVGTSALYHRILSTEKINA